MKKSTRNHLLEIATRLVRAQRDLDTLLSTKQVEPTTRTQAANALRNTLTVESNAIQNIADGEKAMP